MNKEIKKLADEYIESEKKLLEALNNLDCELCNCNDREIIRTIHEGEFSEIVERCLNCGGYIE